MREPFLRADERNDLLERIEILAKPALHEARDGFAELDQAQCKSVPAHGRNAHGFTDALDHRGRGREVSVSGAEVDHIDPAGDELSLLLGDLCQRVFGKTEHTLGVGRHYRLSCTGLDTRLTPGISTSTMSPATRGPTPEGVPVATRSPGSNVMIREM